MTDSSAGDLHDQITGMADAIDSLAGTIGRAKRVNPQHKETANA
jgi:HAMP domain-containing protein